MLIPMILHAVFYQLKVGYKITLLRCLNTEKMKIIYHFFLLPRHVEHKGLNEFTLLRDHQVVQNLHLLK